MKNNQNNQNTVFSLIKVFNAPANLLSLILFFAIGLCFGIILTFHLKNVSFSLHFTQFSLSTTTTAAAAYVITTSEITPPPAKVGLESYLTPPELMHDMTDEELIWRASMAPKVRDHPFERIPKVAFMFLTRGPVVLSPLWDKFSKGNEGLYNIYVHTSDSSANMTEPEDSVFHGQERNFKLLWVNKSKTKLNQFSFPP